MRLLQYINSKKILYFYSFLTFLLIGHIKNTLNKFIQFLQDSFTFTYFFLVSVLPTLCLSDVLKSVSM